MKRNTARFIFAFYLAFILVGGLWANTTLNEMVKERNQQLINQL